MRAEPQISGTVSAFQGLTSHSERARGLHAAFTRWRIARELAPDVQRWFLAYFRLEEAIHAAGGIVYHASMLAASVDRIAIELDQSAEIGAVRAEPGEIVRLRTATASLAEADYFFHDVLWWTRAFDDRMFAQGRGRLQASGLWYLLPSVVTNAAGQAARIVRPILSDARWLANYSLHGESISRLAPTLRRTAAGWELPIPDRPRGPIPTYTNFAYDEGRDALRYCTQAIASIDALLRVLLDAIEVAEAACDR